MWKLSHLSHLSFQSNHECKRMFGYYTLQKLCCSLGRWGGEHPGWVAREHGKTSNQSGPHSHLRIIGILASFWDNWTFVSVPSMLLTRHFLVISYSYSYHSNRCTGDIIPSIVHSLLIWIERTTMTEWIPRDWWINSSYVNTTVCPTAVHCCLHLDQNLDTPLLSFSFLLLSMVFPLPPSSGTVPDSPQIL